MVDERLARVGVIGLGAMGWPMACNLHQAGCLAAVWNRTRAVADDFAAQLPVTVASDPAELARQCDVILLSVSADADVREVLVAARPGMAAGTVVIDTSTIAAETARSVAEQLSEVSAHYIDAPVSGGVEGARKGSLVVMAGGSAEILARVRKVLDVIAARVVHMGPAGAGQAAKAVNQVMAAGINQAVTEALAFGAAQGLPMAQLIEVIGGGAAANWFLSQRGPSMVAGSFPPGFRLVLHHKDLKICQAMAAGYGARLPLIEMTLIHYQRLIDAGHGDEDISALYRSKRRLFDKDAT